MIGSWIASKRMHYEVKKEWITQVVDLACTKYKALGKIKPSKGLQKATIEKGKGNMQEGKGPPSKDYLHNSIKNKMIKTDQCSQELARTSGNSMYSSQRKIYTYQCMLNTKRLEAERIRRIKTVKT